MPGREASGRRVHCVAVTLRAPARGAAGYVVAMDALFFGLTGAALLVFRARERRGAETRAAAGARMPGHPMTTAIFTLAFWTLAATTIAQFPRSAGVGALIMLAGIPAYLLWRRRPAG